jgi:pyruvate/2-oxoglutarate/acetoin dehydrogenase E1 component
LPSTAPTLNLRTRCRMSIPCESSEASMREITYEQAATEAIQEEFRRNPRTVHLSTDLAADLQREFGADRIRVTPIAENNFVGASIGLAGSGFRTIANYAWRHSAS